MNDNVSQNQDKNKQALSKEEEQGNFLYLKSRRVNTQKQYSLDFFCDSPDKKIQPNDIARSALWTVQTSVERINLKNAPIFSSDSTINIFYTGEQLQAATDEKIWLQLVHYARSTKFGDPVRVKISDICRDVGWARNGSYYKTIWASLERLHYGGLKIKKGKNRTLAFIRMLNLYTVKGENIESNGEIEYSLDNSLHGWLILVAGNTTTLLESDAMKRLKPISQRLYTWLASHKDPLPLGIIDFHKLCGSTSKIDTSASLSKWRNIIRLAITQLKEENLIKDGFIYNEEIHIQRR